MYNMNLLYVQWLHYLLSTYRDTAYILQVLYLSLRKAKWCTPVFEEKEMCECCIMKKMSEIIVINLAPRLKCKLI